VGKTEGHRQRVSARERERERERERKEGMPTSAAVWNSPPTKQRARQALDMSSACPSMNAVNTWLSG